MDLSINRVAAQAVTAATKKSQAGSDTPVAHGVSSGEDNVDETSPSLRVNDLKAAVTGASGIDQEKVHRIATAIRNGQYVINPENIAKRLLAAELR
jgi:flagellar biosynthesis anti-sigma factor FlgM